MNKCQFSPKVSLYHANGGGRDSYIYQNNGGLSRTLVALQKSNKESVSPKSLSRQASFSKDTPINRYYNDGTGRDSYVTTRCAYAKNLSLPQILRGSNLLSPQKYSNNLPKITFYSKRESEWNKKLKLKENELMNRIFYSPRAVCNKFKLSSQTENLQLSSPRMSSNKLEPISFGSMLGKINNFQSRSSKKLLK